MKKILICFLLMLMCFSSVSFALDYIEGYKLKGSHRSLEEVARRFMEVKMFQLRQSNFEKFIGMFTNIYANPELKNALWRFEMALNIAVRDRVKEEGFDPNNKKVVKGFSGTFPNERSSWGEARAQFSKGAVHRWFESASKWEANKGIELDSKDIWRLSVATKVFEIYFDDFMLQNLEWFTDGKGKLHIPDFLMEKYKKKYLQGGK